MILDGGTGTELERRGAAMDPKAWCGPATIENREILVAVHRDYIEAGAEVITANTFASSRLMLGAAGFSENFEEINRAAIAAALRARDTSGKDVLVAGSLSHMCPMVGGAAHTDLAHLPSRDEMAEAFNELAQLFREEGCDLILLEMMYHPERMQPAFEAAAQTGLPVWAGFSARRGDDGSVLSFKQGGDTPFASIVRILDDFDVAAAGVMHSPSDLIGEAIGILRGSFSGPLMAYPDSGYFKMPHWQFENVISPQEFRRFAAGWMNSGVQIIGGCCGLSPEHIEILRQLKV